MNFGVGNVVGEAMRLGLGQFFKVLAYMAIFLAPLAGIGGLYYLLAGPEQVSQILMVLFAYSSLLSMAWNVLSIPLVFTIGAFMTREALRDEPSFWGALKEGLVQTPLGILMLILASIVGGVIFIAMVVVNIAIVKASSSWGLLLLTYVPMVGITLYLIYSFMPFVPVLVYEQAGFGCIKRCFQLVSGYRMHIWLGSFVIAVFFGMLSVGATIVIFGGLGVPKDLATWRLVAMAVFTGVMVPLSFSVGIGYQVATYVRLREIDES